DVFEAEFVRQGREEDREILRTLGISWKMLAMLDERMLTKIDRVTLEKYYPKRQEGKDGQGVQGD
ncbi:MAG: V-type ATP synthase subunit B, partial [Thermoplasmata archaeon]|nr:V-type ATP synthase subunit B [Thermoplasmata archaeon]